MLLSPKSAFTGNVKHLGSPMTSTTSGLKILLRSKPLQHHCRRRVQKPGTSSAIITDTQQSESNHMMIYEDHENHQKTIPMACCTVHTPTYNSTTVITTMQAALN